MYWIVFRDQASIHVNILKIFILYTQYKMDTVGETITYSINNKLYHLTTNPLNNRITELYFTDKNQFIIDIPENTFLYVENHHILVDPSNQKYFIHNDTNYVLEINTTILSVKNRRMWDYSFIKI
jgi:hypothetical protein